MPRWALLTWSRCSSLGLASYKTCKETFCLLFAQHSYLKSKLLKNFFKYKNKCKTWNWRPQRGKWMALEKLSRKDIYKPFFQTNKTLTCVNNCTGEPMAMQESRYRREKNWAISWQNALHQQPLLKGLPKQHIAQINSSRRLSNKLWSASASNQEKGSTALTQPTTMLQLSNTNSWAAPSDFMLPVHHICPLQKS